MTQTIQAGIAGGAGYTGGELLRLLIHHPNVNIRSVVSRSQAGKTVSLLHTDLIGETDLVFDSSLSDQIDVLFICMGHGESAKWLAQNPQPDNVKVIDLSQDFRIQRDDHQFVYGLPELNKEAITKATKIANPGCFATAIQLALLPAAKAGLLNGQVHIHATTGSTGAGQQPTATSHFSWRNNNLSVYKAFSHQHLKEINQSLTGLHKAPERQINFLPLRGNFTRGILATAYFNCDLPEAEAVDLYQNFYQEAPFVHLTENVHLKQVVNTNKCLLQVQALEGKILITSVIDNLIKGASGQAIQNMNLLFGFNEKAGLQLKASVF